MAKAPLKYHLINPVKIKTHHKSLDFVTAQSMADEKVKSLCPDPTLISWYNATTGESHPIKNHATQANRVGLTMLNPAIVTSPLTLMTNNMFLFI